MGLELDRIRGSAGCTCMFRESVYDHSAAATNTFFLVYRVVLLALTGCYVGIFLSFQPL